MSSCKCLRASFGWHGIGVSLPIVRPRRWLAVCDEDNLLLVDMPSSPDLLAGLPGPINDPVALESAVGASATLALPLRGYPLPTQGQGSSFSIVLLVFVLVIFYGRRQQRRGGKL